MLKCRSTIRYHITDILAVHWVGFVAQYQRWIRPVVFQNVRKVLSCRTAVLGCHLYRCVRCGHVEVVPHSCKSRFCPTCGKQATDLWSEPALNKLLNVSYHHLILAVPWQLRIVILVNRWDGLNLLFQAAAASVQQWARDVKGMRVGILMVMHSFGADMKWHPHVHLIVTGGGLSLDGRRWIETDPRFLMFHGGLKKRWKYQVVTRMKAAHREGLWRFPKEAGFLKRYPCFAAMLNKLWTLVWYAHIGASLLDPRFSVQYIGRYTKRAVLAEYRITYYDGKCVRFIFKDYAEGGKIRYLTLSVFAFIGRLIRHIPDKHFAMIRYAGLFCNRWRARYLRQCRRVLRAQLAANRGGRRCSRSWTERQKLYRGVDPLLCPKCHLPLRFIGTVFGHWDRIELLFRQAGRQRAIPELLWSG